MSAALLEPEQAFRMSARALEEGRRQGWRGDEKTWGRLLGPDLELNAQGLVSWLDSRAR